MYLVSRLVRCTAGAFPPPDSEPVCDSHQRLGARPRELISSLLMLMLAIGESVGRYCQGPMSTVRRDGMAGLGGSDGREGDGWVDVILGEGLGFRGGF